MAEYKYFKEDEFLKACPPCHLSDMDESTMQRLDKCREIAKVPFVINSAFRSKEYELSKGREGTSAHCFGMAVDIKCTDVSTRFRIVSAAIEVGFTRIGIADSYIHLDDSWFHRDNVIWLYR